MSKPHSCSVTSAADCAGWGAAGGSTASPEGRNSRRMPAATARASCVPLPRPAWGGAAFTTSIAQPESGRFQARRQVRANSSARSASGPRASSRSARRSRRCTPGRSTITPTPPNARASGTPKENMPRCSRAGVRSSTAMGVDCGAGRAAAMATAYRTFRPAPGGPPPVRRRWRTPPARGCRRSSRPAARARRDADAPRRPRADAAASPGSPPRPPHARPG